jgi:hypothetical protein
VTIEEAWRTLNVSPPVSEAALKSAYRNLAKQFHPDRYASFDRKVWAGERFIRVKEAYDFLRNMDTAARAGTDAPPAPEARAAGAPRRASVFDHYADQSEFTERDFIAWLSLWRFGVALCRMAARPWAGTAVVESPPFQAALGCGMLVLLVPVAVLIFPVAALLVSSFAVYVLLQKAVLTMIERVGGTRIGPDSPRLSGQLIYLGLLAICAGLAVPFASYVLSFEDNREWITTSLVWAFAGTLVLTCLLETVLFFRARWLRQKLGADLESALALPP